MVTTRRRNKYINKLAVVLIVFLLVSCSNDKGKFNLIIKSYSSKSEEGVLILKNLKTNNIIKKSIKTKEALNIDLDLTSNYTIEYKNNISNIFAKINKIKPINYDGEKVFLTLNKNKTFKSLLYLITDFIDNNKEYFYLYKDNNIFIAKGNSFNKQSLVSRKKETINKVFNINDNQVLNVDGKFLINKSEITFIGDDGKIKFINHKIGDLLFKNNKFVKVSNNDYFLITEKDDNNYNCISLSRDINDLIKVNKVNNCIKTTDINISKDSKLLVKNNEFYLWSGDTLYKYSNSEFTLFYKFDKEGVIFQNNNNFYLISNNFIYLVELDSSNKNNSKLTKLNLNPINITNIKIFNINDKESLITSTYWKANESYYIFSTQPEIILNIYTFSDEMNLKNMVNIQIDDSQNIFFNNLSFEILSQKFNNINFYLFSNFK